MSKQHVRDFESARSQFEAAEREVAVAEKNAITTKQRLAQAETELAQLDASIASLGDGEDQDAAFASTRKLAAKKAEAEALVRVLSQSLNVLTAKRAAALVKIAQAEMAARAAQTAFFRAGYEDKLAALVAQIRTPLAQLLHAANAAGLHDDAVAAIPFESKLDLVFGLRALVDNNLRAALWPLNDDPEFAFDVNRQERGSLSMRPLQSAHIQGEARGRLRQLIVSGVTSEHQIREVVTFVPPNATHFPTRQEIYDHTKSKQSRLSELEALIRTAQEKLVEQSHDANATEQLAHARAEHKRVSAELANWERIRQEAAASRQAA